MTDTNPAPFHWQTTTLLNQGRQLATQVTDMNGEVTTVDQGTRDPTYTYGSYSQSVSISDGFGQVREVQSTRGGQLGRPGDHRHLLRLARLAGEDQRALLRQEHQP